MTGSEGDDSEGVGRPEMSPASGSMRSRVVGWVFHALILLFFVVLSYYYATGSGGPMLLAVIMVPMSIAVVNLNEARQGYLYPALRQGLQETLALISLALCLSAAIYLVQELEPIRIQRAGLWNAADLLAGGLVVALILEYSWRRYRALFYLNAFLLLYAVYGSVFPGIFQHTGISWTRALTSISLEMSTGVFDRLAQMALTLIGAFILVLAALRAFGCIEAILKASSRLAAHSPQLLPQAAVVGSLAIAAVSGSGAANAATTGTATIPALIRAGFSRVQAAAIETSASLGGQLMPPLMGIAAFMMAEIMGVSYFEVVARGFVPALIYFGGVIFAVYLLTLQVKGGITTPDTDALNRFDWSRLLTWLMAVVGLIWMMGVRRVPPMIGARNVFLWLLLVLLALHLVQHLRRPVPWRKVLQPVGKLVETFAITTSELTVLLSTLGMLTAVFTVTGVPTKFGVLVMEMAEVHHILMILVALAFGYLVGMGLPAAPTYIVLAVVVAPFMIDAGIEPWVVHFFAFFVAVLGELSPPTSVTAAVASRIADASFGRTMLLATGLCMPLLVLTIAVFSRPALVVTPGVEQAGAAALTAIGTAGLIVAMYGRFRVRTGTGRALRCLLVGLSIATVFHPTDSVASAFAIGLTAVLAGIWVWGRRQAALLV